MKTQKKLNVILAVLIILLLSLISFVGVYYKKQNNMVNIVPNYLLGTDLKGYRHVTIEPQKSTDIAVEEMEEETEESETEQEETDAEGNSKEEDNQEEYNTTNYVKTAQIIKERLKSLKVDNYTVSCDESTGRIVISLPENNRTDIILSDITQKGKFTIKDANTDEILLDNSDVKSVKYGTTQTTSSTKTFYMSINFNMRGSSKFKNVTKEYQNIVTENTTSSDEETLNEENELTVENEESNADELNDGEEASDYDDTTDDEETTEESTSKEVKFDIDDTTLLTTYFSEIVDNGVLTLTLGSISADEESDELFSAYNLGAIIENDAIPIQYSITENNYIDSAIESSTLKAFICIEIVLGLIILMVIIAKFKFYGLLSAISSIGYLAILLLVIRIASVELALEGIIAIELSFIINSIFSFIICNKINKKSLTNKEKAKIQKESITKYTLILVPELIIAFVCCFTEWTSIYSFGMVLFWGIVISWIYNTIMTKIFVR